LKSGYVTLEGREIHYTEWGRRGAPPVIMWHGLARTGRDFDDLAAALAGDYHIICPDTLGRGLSQWSPNPDREYSLGFYARLAMGVYDAFGFQTVRWVGTSMGGIIGMRVAGGPLRDRITHLAINDIGPKIADAAIARIRSYAGKLSSFDTVGELETYFRTIYAPFGHLTDEQWRRLTETSVRRTDAGKVIPHYDPNMVRQFELHPGDFDLWPDYERIVAKTLCLRGATSDLLLPDVAKEMTRRGPRCRLETIPGCGHAPALNMPAQIDLMRGFLAG
jgi:pimeloyl-ACP methyl ester carboxylesterase